MGGAAGREALQVEKPDREEAGCSSQASVFSACPAGTGCWTTESRKEGPERELCRRCGQVPASGRQDSSPQSPERSLAEEASGEVPVQQCGSSPNSL